MAPSQRRMSAAAQRRGTRRVSEATEMTDVVDVHNSGEGGRGQAGPFKQDPEQAQQQHPTTAPNKQAVGRNYWGLWGARKDTAAEERSAASPSVALQASDPAGSSKSACPACVRDRCML